MKVGIISDTHDNLVMIKRAVEEFKKRGVSLVLHAGDHISPFTPTIWRDLGKEVLAVFGNNDGDRENLEKRFSFIGKIYPSPKELEVGGKRIYIMHEPDFVEDALKSSKYDIIVYGHTHRKKVYRSGNTLVINPGEGCGWITGEATAMVLDLEDMDVEEIHLGKSPIEAIAP